MPIRIIGYDGAAYRDQIKRVDRRKTKQRYPVVSLVLYFGYEHRWRKAKRLKDCFHIDEALEPFVNDYKLNLFEIAYLSEEQVKLFRSDFRIVADYFVKMRKNGSYEPAKETISHVGEILTLMSALTGDDRFEEVQEEFKREKNRRLSMCEVLDRVEARGIEKGIEKGRAEGRAEGRKIGIMETLIGLVQDDVLTVKDAAARAGISVSTFSKRMKQMK